MQHIADFELGLLPETTQLDGQATRELENNRRVSVWCGFQDEKCSVEQPIAFIDVTNFMINVFGGTLHGAGGFLDFFIIALDDLTFSFFFLGWDWDLRNVFSAILRKVVFIHARRWSGVSFEVILLLDGV